MVALPLHRDAQERTGCRMQIVPLETALKHGIKGQTGEREPVSLLIMYVSRIVPAHAAALA
jgi:hypothetical protein